MKKLVCEPRLRIGEMGDNEEDHTEEEESEESQDKAVFCTVVIIVQLCADKRKALSRNLTPIRTQFF